MYSYIKNLIDFFLLTLTDRCRIAGVMFLAASLALSGMTSSLRFTLLHGVSGSFSWAFFFFLVMYGYASEMDILGFIAKTSLLRSSLPVWHPLKVVQEMKILLSKKHWRLAGLPRAPKAEHLSSIQSLQFSLGPPWSECTVMKQHRRICVIYWLNKA